MTDLRYIENIKAEVSKVMTTSKSTVVIASSGRQGSTMLFHAVREAIVRDQVRGVFRLLPTKTLKRIVSGYPWRPGDFSNSLPAVCKTHIPVNQIPARVNTRVIFVFGDPIDSAYSAFNKNLATGSAWLSRHQNNLMGQGDIKNIFFEDVLNFEGQMLSAVERREKENNTTMLIHYRDLWEKLPKIRSFLDLDISLPEFRARQRTPSFEAVDWGPDIIRLRKLAESVRDGNFRGNG